MSAVPEVPEEELTQELQREDNSLSGRMQARQKAVSEETAQWFALPGYAGVLEIKLRALGTREIMRTENKLNRVKVQELRMLYSLSDQILEATEGFAETSPSGEGRTEIEDSWEDLARRLPNCPDKLTPRRALLHVLGETNVHWLVEEWTTWAKDQRGAVQEAVVRDFGRTG
jgi:hypothetical protein